MRITHSSDFIGADISDFDAGNELNAETFAQVAGVFYDRSVLCLKDQDLTPAQLLAFARHFGEPDVHFLEHYTLPGYPNIFLVSNIQEDGRDIGFADAGRVWHSDGSYMQTPVAVSMLYALEVPFEDGHALGSTQFASAWAAYDGLPAATKRRIEGLEAVHQVAGRRAKTGTGLKDREQEKAQPDALHPLVRVHPVTGRRYIFVNEGECSEVIGLGEDEAAGLIHELAVCVQESNYRHIHNWEVGDLLVWDNQAVQHLASFDYHWPRHRRLMQRVTITENS